MLAAELFFIKTRKSNPPLMGGLDLSFQRG